MKADVVVDLGPYKDSKTNGLTKETQDDVYKRLLRHEHVPAVRQSAPLVAVHEVAGRHVREQRHPQGDRQADPEDVG